LKKLILFLFASIIAASASAQNDAPRGCSTDLMWLEAIKKDPQAAINRQKLLDFAKVFKGTQKRTSSSGIPIFTIPIVFHVIHNYGIENISNAQVIDAVDILNLSFQKLNPDTGDVIPLFQPIFANCEIQFRLANLDPQGNCTNGITHTVSALTTSASDNVKSLIGWPSDQYFNVWVVAEIASGAAGYAYYPGVSSSIDGVVIRHDYVGGIGTSNGSNYAERSLTHEVGHWLNLPHTWGGTNNPGLPSNCGTDDGIADTPNTIGTANFSCNTSQNTCGQIDNVQNYMDYASCHKMFTEGQRDEMHAALYSNIGSRDMLWDPSTLLATGTEDGRVTQTCAPVADVTNKQFAICEGATISLKDVSYAADVLSRVWTFQGGTPATDTSANPIVTYNTVGTYDVTLTVTGTNGSSTITRTGLVNVYPATATNLIPYSESFETISPFPGNDWEVMNEGNTSAWNLVATAGATGTHSLKLLNVSNNPSGNVDAVLTPNFNLTNVTATQLSFAVAFAPRSSGDSSILKVFISTNCGVSWQQRLSRSGSALQTTTNPLFGAFTPNATQWRTETINLSSSLFSGKPSVRVKFEYTNDNGNNIYIDDINISGIVGLNEILLNKYEFKAFPNPADSKLNIELNREEPATVALELFDVTGRKVLDIPASSKTSGAFSTTIENNGYNGMYILSVRINEQVYQQKVMFRN